MMKSFYAVLLCVVLQSISFAEAECPDGWTGHGSSCYVVMNTLTDWYEAKVGCGAIYASLVEIEDADENTFVTGLMKANSVPTAWIGLEDFVTEGRFVWVSNQVPVEYTHWAPGEPALYGAVEDCVMMHMTGAWLDDMCTSHAHAAVCEKSATTSDVIG